MPTPTWTHLKLHLQRLEKQDLLALLRELYALNADNKVFLATRLYEVWPRRCTPGGSATRAKFQADQRDERAVDIEPPAVVTAKRQHLLATSLPSGGNPRNLRCWR